MDSRTRARFPSSVGLTIWRIAPSSNLGGITGPLIGYSHGEALARLHAVTLITEVIDV